MIILLSILGILFLCMLWLGYRGLFRLKHLSRRLVINSFAGVMIVLTLMTVAHWAGLLSEAVAAYATMGLYTVAAGFFLGYGNKLIVLRRRSGHIAYMYRSFGAEIAPNLIALLLVVYGIYRTGILSFGPFTGVGITSGLSLIGFGFWGWTLRVVPEFRAGGILVLDQYFTWKTVVSYEWTAEDTLRIDYITSDKTISEFSTFIPEEDRIILERILEKNIHEHDEERKKILLQDNEN